MRQIGFIPDPVDPRKFEDYLYTQGTLVRMDRHKAGYNVWVFDEDKQLTGKQELLQYLENPQSRVYADAVLIAKNQRIKQEKEDNATPEYKVVFSDQVVQFPRITFLLAICILAVSVPMLLDDEKKTHMVRIFGLNRQGIDFFSNLAFSTQPWRLVTPVFLHFGFLHLLFNIMLLFEFGRLIESQRGVIKFFFLFLVLSVYSNLAQFFLGGISFNQGIHLGPAPIFGGMSGVIYGLLGYAWMKGEFQPELGIFVPSSTVKFMLFWLVLCMTGLMGPVANICHISGLVIGLILGLFPRKFTL
ncbi:MAG: rhomboid family intramembrane serine protease [Planctomycetes bacterium]|nr:rhomboid family intramembrane serine protease [Planctomycetota bacterium]NBY01037.1 rhomboid family intramembrane serine protease [Planctomycetota bacterium]